MQAKKVHAFNCAIASWKWLAQCIFRFQNKGIPNWHWFIYNIMLWHTLYWTGLGISLHPSEYKSMVDCLTFFQPKRPKLCSQMDIDTISDWVNCNNLTLNPTKCKTMVISRKRNSVKPHAQFTLNSSPLEQVETFKYLGILLSSDLSWSSHIDFICTKARKLIGLLYRSTVKRFRLL